MSSFQVIGANNRRTRIEIELPFTESGEWAVDEDGKPIKGAIPVVINLPRFDCMPIDDIVAMQETIRGMETEGKSQQETGRDIALSMIRPHVSERVFELLSARTLFELQQISEEWSNRSTMPPGELLASNGSSKNTRGRSTTNSSASV